MASFDEPERYYRKIDDGAPISQGDIVIAPTVVVRLGIAESNVAGPTELDAERSVTIWQAAVAQTGVSAPSLSADTRWGLAMVIPHPCAMEKD